MTDMYLQFRRARMKSVRLAGALGFSVGYSQSIPNVGVRAGGEARALRVAAPDSAPVLAVLSCFSLRSFGSAIYSRLYLRKINGLEG